MNLEQFLYTLPYMAYGMAGIFAVTLIIVLSIALLNLLTSHSGEKKDGSAEK